MVSGYVILKVTAELGFKFLLTIENICIIMRVYSKLIEYIGKLVERQGRKTKGSERFTIGIL